MLPTTSNIERQVDSFDDGRRHGGTTAIRTRRLSIRDFLESSAPIFATPRHRSRSTALRVGPGQYVFRFDGNPGFFGGTLSLYDSSNTCYCVGHSVPSGLTGPMMPPGTGGLFSTYVNGEVTGGSLAPILIGYIHHGVDMHLPLIQGGAGFSPVTAGQSQ